MMYLSVALTKNIDGTDGMDVKSDLRTIGFAFVDTKINWVLCEIISY